MTAIAPERLSLYATPLAATVLWRATYKFSLSEQNRMNNLVNNHI